MGADLPHRTALGRVDPAELRRWAIAHVCVEDAELAGGGGGGAAGVPYRPSPAQELFWRSRAARLEPCCQVVVKGRQAGNTTQDLVFAAAAMIECAGLRVLVMVPDDKMKEVRGKWRIIEQSIADSPGSGWPGQPDNRNEKFTLWANGSQITWQKAGGTERTATRAGTAGTPHLVIFSEFAFVEHALDAFDSVEPAVSRARGTIIIDSTPNQKAGLGQDYIELARRAASGRDPWYELLVLPWWLNAERKSATLAPLPLEPDERHLAETQGLDGYQIQWRRTKLAQRGRSFFLAYVETVEQALAPVESGAWDPEVLARLLERRDTPGGFSRPLRPEVLWAAMPDAIRPPLPSVSPGPGAEERAREAAISSDLLLRALWDDHGPEEPRGPGYVRIWATPGDLPPGRCYLGVDPSEGLAHGDAIGGVMLDALGDLVLTLRLHVDPTVAAGVLQRLATWYGAVTTIERSSTWDTIQNAMRYALDAERVRELGAHPILCTRHAGAITTVNQQAKINRVVAYRSWLNSGRDPRDPQIVHEMLEHDPVTGKARTKRGDDDLLDAKGIAASEHPRLRGGRGGTGGGEAASRVTFGRRHRHAPKRRTKWT